MKTTKQTIYILEVYGERIEFHSLNELYRYMDKADFGFGEIYMKNGDSIVNINSNK